MKRYEIGWNGPAGTFALFEQPEGSIVKWPDVAALVEAARAYIDAAEKEAKAQLTLSNAEANFSNPEPERQRAIEAIGAAGVALTALRTAAFASGVASTPALDPEDLIRSCVPGGFSCDPQRVADDIRAYFAARANGVTPTPARRAGIMEVDVTAALAAACLLDSPQSRKDMRRALETVFAAGVLGKENDDAERN